jgi:hypothetical protein
MVFPLWLVPDFATLLGPGCRVLASIENAAADGKRLRAIDALAIKQEIARRGRKTPDCMASLRD